MLRYTTAHGDMLDLICWRYYGRTSGVVEAVLAANPGLAALGPVYAAGVEIALPDAAPTDPTAAPVARLWD